MKKVIRPKEPSKASPSEIPEVDFTAALVNGLPSRSRAVRRAVRSLGPCLNRFA